METAQSGASMKNEKQEMKGLNKYLPHHPSPLTNTEPKGSPLSKFMTSLFQVTLNAVYKFTFTVRSTPHRSSTCLKTEYLKPTGLIWGSSIILLFLEH